MKTTTFRSRLVPVALAAATLASISVPAVATARAGHPAARAERPTGATTPDRHLAQPGPRMI